MEISMMECLVMIEEGPKMRFLHQYGLHDNVKALKGKCIERMKSFGMSLRMEELVVTFAGKQLPATENISKLRIPIRVDDRIVTYNASNEPFMVAKRVQ